jgi:hypothetical protein
MNRLLLSMAFVVLLAGCGSEPGTSSQPAAPPPDQAPSLSDEQARQRYKEEVQKVDRLVHQAALLLEGIVGASDARRVRPELDKLSDEVALVAREIVKLGVDNSRNVLQTKKRVEFFATEEELRGALVPLQANDSSWRVIRPSVDRFKRELDKLKLGI